MAWSCYVAHYPFPLLQGPYTRTGIRSITQGPPATPRLEDSTLREGLAGAKVKDFALSWSEPAVAAMYVMSTMPYQLVTAPIFTSPLDISSWTPVGMIRSIQLHLEALSEHHMLHSRKEQAFVGKPAADPVV